MHGGCGHNYYYACLQILFNVRFEVGCHLIQFYLIAFHMFTSFTPNKEVETKIYKNRGLAKLKESEIERSRMNVNLWIEVGHLSAIVY